MNKIKWQTSLPHEVANRDNSNKDARAKDISDEYVHHYGKIAFEDRSTRYLIKD